MKENQKVSVEQALKRIDGWLAGDKVIYYDDAISLYYVGPASDLDYLRELMADEDMSGDAYSHWCSGTSHGDGYATQEEAEAAAKE